MSEFVDIGLVKSCRGEYKGCSISINNKTDKIIHTYIYLKTNSIYVFTYEYNILKYYLLII